MLITPQKFNSAEFRTLSLIDMCSTYTKISKSHFKVLALPCASLVNFRPWLVGKITPKYNAKSSTTSSWLRGVKHLSLNYLFYESVGLNPGRALKCECNFFRTDLFTFFFLKNTKGASINYVDPFPKLYHCPNPLYRIVCLR